MKNEHKTFTLYKIYSENCLLYIGRTKQNLQTRLHGHFFKAPMMRSIDIDCVTKIEYATFPTEATMNVYEVYYINLFKPPLNRDDKARDELTVSLPDVPFHEFNCNLMNKWREQIHEADRADELKKRHRAQVEMERRNKRQEIYSREDLTPEQKGDLFYAWLEEYYEPVRNGLI